MLIESSPLGLSVIMDTQISFPISPSAQSKDVDSLLYNNCYYNQNLGEVGLRQTR